MSTAPKNDIVEIIRSTARFGKAYALRKYNTIISAAQNATIFNSFLLNNAIRLHLYIDTYQEYQQHLDALREIVEKLQNLLIYNHTCLLQSLYGIDFLSAVVPIAKMGILTCFLPRNSFTPTLSLTLPSNSLANPMAIKYSGKKKSVAMCAVMHKTCNIIFAMLRDNKPFEIITPKSTAGGLPQNILIRERM